MIQHRIRLHLPAIPHTITCDEFSHCAFTGKVLRFAPMMQQRGFEVFHYGVETSTSGASQHIDLLTKAEWDSLRYDSMKQLHPSMSDDDVRQHLSDPRQFVGDLANWSTPLYQRFNAQLKVALQTHYRGPHTDIVCLPFGKAHCDALRGWPPHQRVLVVESGIGYPDSFADYRIFESYAHLHTQLALEKTSHCPFHWFVAPNYFRLSDWRLSIAPTTAPAATIGFFGRLCAIKGLHIVLELAQRWPHLAFVLCGQGTLDRHLVLPPNVTVQPPIHGTQRSDFLGSLTALLAPSLYVEPFCGVNVEAQLCGTPVLTTDFGAFAETVEHLVTGLRCHTLADYCLGIQLALRGDFDRAAIRQRAERLYSTEAVGKQYERAFKTLLDQFGAADGWYNPKSHIVLD